MYQELEALTCSIREFGLVDPIMARHDDKIVIGGHRRLLAARKLGLVTVPVVCVDLSREQARLLNLALNKLLPEHFPLSAVRRRRRGRSRGGA